jgi:hypothetical protein
MCPWKFRVVSVAWAAFLGKVKTESAVIDIDVETKVGYVGMTWRAILVVEILLVLVGRLLRER